MYFMEYNQQRKKSKQNITRDIEIKNNLTIARGEVGGDNGGRVFRSYYKGHMDKPSRRVEAREVGLAGVGGSVGGKCRQL